MHFLACSRERTSTTPLSATRLLLFSVLYYNDYNKLIRPRDGQGVRDGLYEHAANSTKTFTARTPNRNQLRPPVQKPNKNQASFDADNVTTSILIPHTKPRKFQFHTEMKSISIVPPKASQFLCPATKNKSTSIQT